MFGKKRWVGVLVMVSLVVTMMVPVVVFAGRPIGASDLNISNLAGDQGNPSVAYNAAAGEYLVVWHNERAVYPDIQAQRVGVDGELVGGPFYIAGGPGFQRRNPDVVYNPVRHEYLVVWEELPDGGESNVFAQRVGATGLLIGSPTGMGNTPVQTSRFRPAVAHASTSDLYMVVWQNLLHGNTSHDIEAQILRGDGLLFSGDFRVAIGSATLDHTEPDIAYNRSRNEHLIVWTRHDLNVQIKDVWGQIITRDGVSLGPNFFIGYHTSNDFDAAVVGTPVAPGFGGYYVVWTMEYSPGDLDIYGKEVGWDGLTGTYDQISTAGYYSDSEPVVAYDEWQKQFFVAWSRVAPEPDTERGVVGFPYLPKDPRGPLERFVAGSAIPFQPAIAPGPGGDFLVTWSDAPRTIDRDVFGRIWSFSVLFADGFESGGTSQWSASVP